MKMQKPDGYRLQRHGIGYSSLFANIYVKIDSDNSQ